MNCFDVVEMGIVSGMSLCGSIIPLYQPSLRDVGRHAGDKIPRTAKSLTFYAIESPPNFKIYKK